MLWWLKSTPALIASIGLTIIGLQGNSDQAGPVAEQTAETLLGLRLIMTILPMVLLLAAILFFRGKFRLTDDVVQANSEELRRKRG